ncbi:energy transducer TonB [Acinetobacter baumannii]|uniref:Putative tonB-like protein n=1 Tax=Acinetobacter baumannii TaxID=470 RepID=A0A505MMA6_ACIBA|nr:energy transducer TonB [Acinetobacter baumannii]EJB8494409.1 energy transducer TonB [Acinetobacter baumannii]ELB0343147.1 energy transducer TonB [Acinetobacter baumannii]EMC7949661.1 energy transducer TonB [Acinetobacter baumannii]EMD9691015.1 energy transducer TonB [Acinetobacter baumannii]KCY24018.1 tonB family C-terminal domain protein [Acinetobacter baumannii 233846]
MRDQIFNPHKRALLFEQFATVAATTEIADPFAQHDQDVIQPAPVKLNKVLIAIVAVASAHLGIWYVAKQLPTPALDIHKPEPVVIEIVKPVEPPKVIEPKIPPITEKPKVPPVVEKPKPIPKQVEQPKPVQKSVEQPKPVAKAVAEPTPQKVAEPVVTKEVVTEPVKKVAEPVKASDDNLPVTEAKGYAGYLSNPAPEYPEQALERGWEGSVILRVKVLANGSPDTVGVKQSSGKKILDSAAVRTVKQWKFSPALKGKTPVEGWVDVPIHYQLPK